MEDLITNLKKSCRRWPDDCSGTLSLRHQLMAIASALPSFALLLSLSALCGVSPLLATEPIASFFCYPVSPIRQSAVPGDFECSVAPEQTINPNTTYRNAQGFLPPTGAHHLGDDWNGSEGGSGDLGDPVYSVADGRVVYVKDLGDGAPHSWGKVLIVRYQLQTGEVVYGLYAHLESFLVPSFCHLIDSLDCEVQIGQQIATIGDANGWYSIPANCDPPSALGCGHLHFEIRKQFLYLDPEVIPGHGYIADPNNPFVNANYYDPTAFIELHRANQCVPPFGSNGLAVEDCGAAPEATTVAASDLTQASATLNAAIDPNGAATQAWFEWGPTASLGLETIHVSAGSGTTPISLSQTLSGLQCETTYRFRAAAENAVGPSLPANILSFTTSACGSGGAQSLELIRNGDFLANGQYWTLSDDFQADQRFSSYHYGPGYAYLALPDGSAGNGLYGTLHQQVAIPANATSAELTFWTKITTSEPTGGAAEDFLNATLQTSSGTFLAGLREYSNRDASSSYVKRTFDLSNFVGDTVRLHFLGLTNSDTQPTTFRIDDVSLLVEVPAGTSPTVVTSAPDQITESSARLRGTVNPNGLATDVWFDLEAGDSTPDPDTEHFGIGSGTSIRSISYSVFDLECGTTYWVEAIGSNSEGTVVGAPRSFQTSNCPGTPPRADTRPADGIEAFSARLNAEIWPEGSPTTAWFEWGTTPTLGNAMNPQSAGSVAGTSTSIERTLTGLACGTLYYFEAHAQNGAGVDDGATLSFSTVACPGPPETSMPLWVSRQGCAGPAPAVRLEWDMPPTADPIVQIEQLDVGYIATVDTRDGGPKYIVQSGLVPVGTFEFRIHGTDSTVPIQSNVAVAYVYLADCDRQVAADELPHQPLAQATAFCEGGIPKVLVEWTPVLGAETYAVYRYGALGPNAVYEGVVATQLVDSPLSAGMGANYQVRALNGVGQTSADMFGVLVPGDICGVGASPGPFTVSVTQEPYCDGGYGRFNWARSTAANALANYRWFGFNNSELETFDDSHTSSTGNMTSNVGDFRRVVVQAESSSVPGQYREARSVARILPADLCGAFANPPTATISTRKYVDATSAVVIGTVRPAGSPTEAHFEWGLTTGYGSTSPSHDFGRAPVQPSRVGELFTGLSCGTDFHFRLVASNANGTGVSNDLLVSTRSCPPNGAPSATADEYWVDEDVELVVGAPGVLGNDSDPEGSAIVSELLTLPASGSLIAYDSGAFTYMPNPDFWGMDSFSYRASDGALASSPATVTIHVAAVEEPPEIFFDGFESGDMTGWSFAVP